MQAIKVKYLGATNCRPSRLKASAEAGSVTLSWDHALNPGENYQTACDALCAKFNWSGRYVGGQHGDAHYFVCVPTSVINANLCSDCEVL